MNSVRLSDAAFRNERGIGMMMAIIVLALLGAIGAAYHANVLTALKLGQAEGRERAGFYAAEAGLNVGLTRFVNDFRHYGVPTQAEFSQELQIGTHTVDIDLEAVSGCAPCAPSRIPVGELFGGLNTVPYDYTVQSRSMDTVSQEEAHIGGEFVINNIPIFQFLAFINNHLFIMPITATGLHGRLHSNSNIYVDGSTGSTVTVGDLQSAGIKDVQMTAAGRIYRGGRKYDSGWLCEGTVNMDMFEDKVSPANDNDPKAITCSGGGTPLTDTTLAAWKGSIDQQVANIVTPDPGIMARGSGDYWKKADLRIVLNLSAGLTAINFGDADLCPGAQVTAPATLSTTLYPIEVQDAGGNRDIARTRALWRFMCERRGAIFYNELPQAYGVTSPPNNSTDSINNSPLTEYAPQFGVGMGRAFRRVGEDTNGDGVVSGTDRNCDICPPNTAPYTWWRPAYCGTTACVGAGKPCVTDTTCPWYQDMDYRRGAFWNQREEQWMRLLNVNVRALIDWNEFNGNILFNKDDTSDGGLVFFFTVQGPNSTAASNNYGVRVFDSADLNTLGQTFKWPAPADPTGLTVVSDQAILIEGNYNSVNRYPAALMGDAIYTLSQGWETPSKNCGTGWLPNDLKSARDLSTNDRDVPSSDCMPSPLGSFAGAANYTINAAWIFGLGPSTKNKDWYNGGLENFPKYLESWTGKTLNYRGSFVSLGQPLHKLNNWPCGSGNECNVYDPPGRNFDYEPSFNQVEWLPPMTPMIVFAQQRLYTRFFK
jgi:hypothetical protein